MIFNVMFYGGLVLFILFLIATVALFFLLKIPKALGVVTGQTQKKAIEEIRSGGRASTSKRGKGSFIQARDVGTASGTLKESGISFGRKKEEKRSSDAAASLAEKAANDAKKAVEEATASKQSKRRAGKKQIDESEATEVLTYNESKKKELGEETTSILEEEQSTAVLSECGDDDATDVLTSGGNSETAGQHRSVAESDDDAATDVLKSTDLRKNPEEEETTDILRTAPAAVDFDDESDEVLEEDTTDILTSDMESKFAENEIYGTYNPEMTAVLRSDITPGEDSVHSGARNIEGITILYSETIVHTDECL